MCVITKICYNYNCIMVMKYVLKCNQKVTLQKSQWCLNKHYFLLSNCNILFCGIAREYHPWMCSPRPTVLLLSGLGSASIRIRSYAQALPGKRLLWATASHIFLFRAPERDRHIGHPCLLLSVCQLAHVTTRTIIQKLKPHTMSSN